MSVEIWRLGGQREEGVQENDSQDGALRVCLPLGITLWNSWSFEVNVAKAEKKLFLPKELT